MSKRSTPEVRLSHRCLFLPIGRPWGAHRSGVSQSWACTPAAQAYSGAHIHSDSWGPHQAYRMKTSGIGSGESAFLHGLRWLLCAYVSESQSTALFWWIVIYRTLVWGGIGLFSDQVQKTSEVFEGSLLRSCVIAVIGSKCHHTQSSKSRCREFLAWQIGTVVIHPALCVWNCTRNVLMHNVN